MAISLCLMVKPSVMREGGGGDDSEDEAVDFDGFTENDDLIEINLKNAVSQICVNVVMVR